MCIGRCTQKVCSINAWGSIMNALDAVAQVAVKLQQAMEACTTMQHDSGLDMTVANACQRVTPVDVEPELAAMGDVSPERAAAEPHAAWSRRL